MSKANRVRLIAILIILGILSGVIWFLWPYPPSEVALEAMKSDDTVKVTEEVYGVVFEPPQEPIQQLGVIMYPGALVKPESYAAMGRLLASYGHRTIVATMPIHLAVFDKSIADDIMNAYPDQSFVIGGHSLGGAMAARYTAEQPDKVKGIFLLAAYADNQANIANSKLPVLSITATNDTVLNWDAYESFRANLPEHTRYVSIEGGNHAQFGEYGVQKGDGVATILPEEQRKQVVNVIADWLSSLK